MKQHNRPIGVELFAGAGGMSLGAKMAGIDVAIAVENDPHAAATYAHNNPETKLIVNSVEKIRKVNVTTNGRPTVLFGAVTI